tara:strand:+ start:6912 stop:7127 length:216 start_codon:yes stop_codon:yes gene_type:complete
MERILHKAKGRKRKVVEIKPIKSDMELPESLKVYLTLTKKELVSIIKEKNDLLIQYSNWIEELKNDKKKEG